MNNSVITKHLKSTAIWLLAGPVLALSFSFVSWYLLDQFTPGKLHELSNLVSTYPLGLAMSLLTPWGWLMYGGLLFMSGNKFRMGLYCTLAGALILGAFWPVWSMQLATA